MLWLTRNINTNCYYYQATEEVRCLESFYKMLKQEPGRAFYGPKHVMRACEAEAIETLLISDKLFRANNVAERRKERRFFCCKFDLFYSFLTCPLAFIHLCFGSEPADIWF